MMTVMNSRWILPALLAGSMCTAYVAQAEGEKEVYTRLKTDLQEQLRVLRSMTNPASTQAGIPALDKVLKRLRELNTQTDEAELWRYIDNTPGVKQPLITILEDTMVQLHRIEQAKFYANKELRRRLAPMLNSAPAPGV